MPHKTKRQQQVAKLSRKKGRYISQKTTRKTPTEEIVEPEEAIKIEDEAVGVEGENVDYWTEEDLREFEKAGKRLITKALNWHKNAANSIRAAYTGTSRTTIWRQKNKKKA